MDSRRVRFALRIGSAIQPEQEVVRLQHRLSHQLRALDKIGLMAHQRLVALLLLRIERPAERFEAEFANEAGTAGGRWFARNQAVRIASQESRASQLLRGGAVRLDQDRRKRLGLRLVSESV